MIKYFCALSILFSGFAFSNGQINYTDSRGMLDIKDGTYSCTSHMERTGTDKISQGNIKIGIKKIGDGKLVATIYLGEKVKSPELPIATQSRDSVSYSLMIGTDDNGVGWSVKSVRDEGLGLMFMHRDSGNSLVLVTDSCSFVNNNQM
ncbi:TPA: hypothetical protein ACJTPC_001731 [Providencia alcalifaciens]